MQSRASEVYMRMRLRLRAFFFFGVRGDGLKFSLKKQEKIQCFTQNCLCISSDTVFLVCVCSSWLVDASLRLM